MKDKVVVITGGSRGLGKSLADLLVTKGAHVVVSSRSKIDFDNVTSISADVTKESDHLKILEEALTQFGKVDIWINNAGVWLPRAPLEEIDMKRAHDIFEVNVFGTAYGSRVAITHMKKQGYGTIINIVSSAALQGRPNSSMYSASKHAAKGLTDSLREEVKDKNIRVIGIYPGGFKSNLFDEAKPSDFDDYMTTESVAEKIVENLEKAEPLPELILKRPGQK